MVEVQHVSYQHIELAQRRPFLPVSRSLSHLLTRVGGVDRPEARGMGSQHSVIVRGDNTSVVIFSCFLSVPKSSQPKHLTPALQEPSTFTVYLCSSATCCTGAPRSTSLWQWHFNQRGRWCCTGAVLLLLHRDSATSSNAYPSLSHGRRMWVIDG